jgi:hypothetical protein
VVFLAHGAQVRVADDDPVHAPLVQADAPAAAGAGLKQVFLGSLPGGAGFGIDQPQRRLDDGPGAHGEKQQRHDGRQQARKG